MWCKGQTESVKVGDRGTKNYDRRPNPDGGNGWRKLKNGQFNISLDVISISVM